MSGYHRVPAHRNEHPTVTGTQYSLSGISDLFIIQPTAGGKDFCCIFGIPGALTCFQCATTEPFAGANLISPSSIRAPHSQVSHSNAITTLTPCPPESFLSCLHHPGCFDILRRSMRAVGADYHGPVISLLRCSMEYFRAGRPI
ncbi:hypothetical protein D9611_008055 [Ephemerocybe angulata]|uniref:Uncharacterized protein n=1 Tax=Ephemerocybe angulata TaxID=980116 RepID=A0A8H5BZ81_9AGAR|nr:hypothetical protein D9611_008055 [Tulosesus angulatus]